MKMFNLTKLIKLANQQVQAGSLNRNLNSKISVMGGEQAASVMATVSKDQKERNGLPVRG